MTDHEALSRYASPMGPKPVPNEADYEAARELVAEMALTRLPSYIEANRETLVRYAAEAAMQKRMGDALRSAPGRSAAAPRLSRQSSLPSQAKPAAAIARGARR